MSATAKLARLKQVILDEFCLNTAPGYISNGATTHPTVTFLNGLTRIPPASSRCAPAHYSPYRQDSGALLTVANVIRKDKNLRKSAQTKHLFPPTKLLSLKLRGVDGLGAVQVWPLGYGHPLPLNRRWRISLSLNV